MRSDTEGATRAPRPSEIRRNLPRGLVLDPDGQTVRRDRRALFRDGWMLALALVCFGAAAIGLFWMSLPRGIGAWVKLGLSTLALLIVGAWLAPRITRVLYRR